MLAAPIFLVYAVLFLQVYSEEKVDFSTKAVNAHVVKGMALAPVACVPCLRQRESFSRKLLVTLTTILRIIIP